MSIKPDPNIASSEEVFKSNNEFTVPRKSLHNVTWRSFGASCSPDSCLFFLSECVGFSPFSKSSARWDFKRARLLLSLQKILVAYYGVFIYFPQSLPKHGFRKDMNVKYVEYVISTPKLAMTEAIVVLSSIVNK